MQSRIMDLRNCISNANHRYSDPSPPSSSLPLWTPVPPTGQTNVLDLNLMPKMKTELDKDKEFFWQRMIWDHREGSKNIIPGLSVTKADGGLSDDLWRYILN